MSDKSDKRYLELKDNNLSTADVDIDKVQRSAGLIIRGGTCLVWKPFMLPVYITAGTVKLIMGSVGLGFWMACGVLSYLLSVIEFMTNSGPQQGPSTYSPRVSNSVSTTAEAIDFDQAKEDQNPQELARLCEEKVLSLGNEPDYGPDVTQVWLYKTKVFVRLPTGERKGRRFHCDAKLQFVYDFVDSSGCLEVGSYRLVPFFPRVHYGQDELSSTLEELGLYPQTTLFVELNT